MYAFRAGIRVQLTLEISIVTKNTTVYYCQFGRIRPTKLKSELPSPSWFLWQSDFLYELDCRPRNDSELRGLTVVVRFEASKLSVCNMKYPRCIDLRATNQRNFTWQRNQMIYALIWLPHTYEPYSLIFLPRCTGLNLEPESKRFFLRCIKQYSLLLVAGCRLRYVLSIEEVKFLRLTWSIQTIS